MTHLIENVRFYRKGTYFGRVLYLSSDNKPLGMIEIAWDRYLMKIFDSARKADTEEMGAMKNLVDIKDSEWKELDSTSNYDKDYIRDIISALNSNSEKYRDIVSQIIQLARSQRAIDEDEAVPSPIPHPDVNGVEGPPKPENAIL